jgi:hypothetical protein
MIGALSGEHPGGGVLGFQGGLAPGLGHVCVGSEATYLTSAEADEDLRRD